MSDFLEVFPSFTFWNWYAIWLCCFVHLHLLRFRSFSTAMMHNHPGLWITDFAKFRISISEGSLRFCFHHLVCIFILAFSSCIHWGLQLNPHENCLKSQVHLVPLQLRQKVFDPLPLHVRPHPWCCTTESSFGHSSETPHHLKDLSCFWPWQLLTI